MEKIHGDIITGEQEKELAKLKFEQELTSDAISADRELRHDLLKELAGKGLGGVNLTRLGDMTTNELLAHVYSQTDPKNWINLNPEDAAVMLSDEQYERWDSTRIIRGEFSEAEQKNLAQAQSVQNAALGIFSTVNFLLDEDQRSALGDSVGIGLGRRNLSAITGIDNAKVNRWRAKFSNLLSKEVLKYYSDIKTSGVTFGALSEKELRLLENASIGHYGAVLDDDGVLTGKSKLGESDFIEELQLTASMAQKAFIMSSRGRNTPGLAETLRNMSPEAVNTMFEEIRTSIPSKATGFAARELQAPGQSTPATTPAVLNDPEELVVNYSNFSDRLTGNVTGNQFVALNSFEADLGSDVWDTVTGQKILENVNNGNYSEAARLIQLFDKAPDPATGQLIVDNNRKTNRAREATLLIN